MFCGRSSMVEHQLPKLNTRVRFPSPAPRRGEPLWFVAFFCAKCGFTVRVAAPLREKSRSARLFGCKRPRLRLTVATNFSRLKGIVLWVSILSPQPSGKLPLPSRDHHFCGGRDFCCPRLCVKWDSGALGSTEGMFRHPLPSFVNHREKSRNPKRAASSL